MLLPFKPIERDPLWKREVRERWRRPWTFLLMGAYATFLAILARVFYGSIVPEGDVPFSRAGLGLGAPLFWKFVMWQIAGWCPLGLMLGAPSLALERERQSLTDYALAGLTSTQVVRAKWWSLVTFALVLVVAPLPVAALCFSLGGLSPFDFWSANALCVGVAVASCTAGLAISAIHRTVSAAFVEILKRIIFLGYVMGPPLLLVSFFPPPLLLVLGLGLCLVPFFLLPRIEQEVFFVMRHLEVDAPRTPDYSQSPDDVPLRLEPMLVKYAEGASQAHEPMNSQELARYMNAAEVELGRLDPPPSHLNRALEDFVAPNPLAQRDVHTQLRAWRRQLLIAEPAPIFSLRVSLLVGGALAIMGLIVSKPGVAGFLYALWRFSVLPIFLQIVLLAASGFTRERAGNMMVQLQLTALSKSQIVAAKLVAPFIMGARIWGFPLLILTIAALSYSVPRVAFEAFFFLLLALLASLVGTLCSLLFRAISFSTSAALFLLIALFGVIPVLCSSMLFRTPVALQLWWLEPIGALAGGTGQVQIAARLLLPLSLLLAGLWWACLRAWEKSVS